MGWGGECFSKTGHLVYDQITQLKAETKNKASNLDI